MLSKAHRMTESGEARQLLVGLPLKERQFIEYWFSPKNAEKLAALVEALRDVSNSKLRNFLEVLLSSIIVTKSGGVSLARDLAHSRPHKDPTKNPPDVFEAFEAKVRKTCRALEASPTSTAEAIVIRGDARALPLKENSVDLVVTSPPYANAIDYVRAHKFSLVWFGYKIEWLSKSKRKYIGTESPSSGTLVQVTTLRKVLGLIRAKDQRRAKIVGQYFADMREVLREIRRVLKPSRAAIIVVGPSTVRGVHVPTHEILAEIGESVGLKVVDIRRRPIDRDRRLMPMSRGSKGEGIEARIREEFVIGFLKEG